MSSLTPRHVIIILTLVVLCSVGGAAVSPARNLIDRPLDASAYRDRVCELLTPDQTAALGLGTGEDFHLDLSKRMVCDWSVPVSNGPARISYYYSTGVISEIYRSIFDITGWRDQEFTPLTIAGQPGARSGNAEPGYCQIAVGLTDHQGLDVVAWVETGDSCDLAEAIAETVVDNLAE